MRNIVVRKRNPIFVLFSIIFWLVACLTTILIVVLSILNKINHEKKWSDYDDCGIF